VLQAKPRAEDRTKAIIAAQMRADSGDQEVTVIDVSTRGLLLACDEPPARGAFVELVISGHRIAGQVKWSGSRRFGVSLRERISVIGLLSGEKAQITLVAREAAGKRRVRLERGSVPVGRVIQFAGILCAIAVSAWLMADYAGQGLGSVR
jgi:hypothetical protein